MSRITPSGPKVTRTLQRVYSSSAITRSPSSVFLVSQARVSYHLPRPLKDLKTECSIRGVNQNGTKTELAHRLAAHDIASTQGFHTTAGHRPTTSQVPTSVYRTIPMMQGFQSSAPLLAPRDNSTIDFFFLPKIDPAPPLNPFEKLRVPLLPDNYNPDRSPGSINDLQATPMPSLSEEISIMASRPEQILPAGLREVVGNNELDGEVGEMMAEGVVEKVMQGPGMLRELLGVILDDFLGPKRKVA